MQCFIFLFVVLHDFAVFIRLCYALKAFLLCVVLPAMSDNDQIVLVASQWPVIVLMLDCLLVAIAI